MGTFVDDVQIQHIDTVKRERHGLPWDKDEYANLEELFKRGESLNTICRVMKRPAAGVLAKLKGQNLITHNYATTGYDYVNNVTTTTPQPKPQLEKPEMTQPLQNLTLVFGNDIKTMSESQLIKAIQTCQNEMVSFSNIPRNKWTEKRNVELKAAIDAAVAELDTRA